MAPDGTRTPPAEGEHTLVTLFLTAAQEMIEELVDAIAAEGYDDIRAAHSRVFENLRPEGRTLAQLAERATITHQSMSELVAGLEADGYVERRPDPSDRRAKLIFLTPRGKAVMRVAMREIERIETKWLDRLEKEGVRGDLRASLEHVLRGG